MQQTKNLNLNKPDYSDVADIMELNKNMDIIDEKVHKNEENISNVNSNKADINHNHNNGADLKNVDAAKLGGKLPGVYALASESMPYLSVNKGNFDSLTNRGIYEMKGCSKAPVSGKDYGLIVLDSGDSITTVQIAFAEKIYVRNYTSAASWSAWMEITAANGMSTDKITATSDSYSLIIEAATVQEVLKKLAEYISQSMTSLSSHINSSAAHNAASLAAAEITSAKYGNTQLNIGADSIQNVLTYICNHIADDINSLNTHTSNTGAAGTMHIPRGGTAYDILGYGGSSGTAAWVRNTKSYFTVTNTSLSDGELYQIAVNNDESYLSSSCGSALITVTAYQSDGAVGMAALRQTIIFRFTNANGNYPAYSRLQIIQNAVTKDLIFNRIVCSFKDGKGIYLESSSDHPRITLSVTVDSSLSGRDPIYTAAYNGDVDFNEILNGEFIETRLRQNTYVSTQQITSGSVAAGTTTLNNNEVILKY